MRAANLSRDEIDPQTCVMSANVRKALSIMDVRAVVYPKA